MRQGVEIIVGTPGRLIDLIRDKLINLPSRTSFVVLDEADRMFEMGFEYQIRSLLTQIRPDKQLLMFSATFRQHIETISEDLLVDPIKITIGNQFSANEDINQFVHICSNEESKWQYLANNLPGLVNYGQVIIFANTIGKCEQLYNNINSVYENQGNYLKIIFSRFNS